MKIQSRIESLANEIKEKKQELAALRREAESTEVKDYAILDSFGNSLNLSSLFGEKKELILVHNMGRGCPYCTLWADGFNGLVKHIESRAAFVIESPENPEDQRVFATDRGWTFRMVSSQGTSFRKDMGYADAKGSPHPGISVFVKKGAGKIHRVAHAPLGPGDNFCVVWDLFDLLPGGSKNWDDDVDYFYSKVR